MTSEAPSDHELAERWAQAAGDHLIALRARLADAGSTDRELKDEGDRTSHELIMEMISAARPDDAILSEEGTDDRSRLTADRVWIIDPLDGTREFGEVPRVDWAVHVALAINGTVDAAAVALPAQSVTFSTAAPPALPPRDAGPPRLIVSRSRPPKIATGLAERLDGVLVEMGSAGAKAMAVIQGQADIYAHAGGQYEWDSAAPIGVAAAAGCHVSRLDGTPMIYNNEDPYLPDLLICRPEYADVALRHIGALGTD